MNANAQEQLQLLHDLRQALERRQLVLHYQPKVLAPNGPMVGVEALLRWEHPQHGLIPPTSSCRWRKNRPDRADRRVGARRSLPADAPLAGRRACGVEHRGEPFGLQFAHAGLVDSVRNALLRHSLEPSHLILEVTESTAMRDADAGLVILEQLSAMGVGISIDDFGTGYSSLLYLKRLPASELKIDRGFINELAHDSDDAAIVSAIVALGRTLNLKIVAEGVETEAQQEFLTRLGCNSLQGFLLGRPMPAEQLLASVARAPPAARHGTCQNRQIRPSPSR
ncbi:EAL domain-containing protein [Pseudomonas aeruginosa]|nr:EAL domain-containing protein [Pseudomonas aeruginosa]